MSKLTSDDFEQVLSGYFQGWRDGYNQALTDVQDLLDGDGQSHTPKGI